MPSGWSVIVDFEKVKVCCEKVVVLLNTIPKFQVKNEFRCMGKNKKLVKNCDVANGVNNSWN